MYCTWATGNNVRIHHNVRQSPIAIEWVIEMETDGRLLFLVYQPVIAWDFGVMFVGFPIATSPLIKGTTVDFSPPQNVCHGKIRLL
jgi:hypothetical protein